MIIYKDKISGDEMFTDANKVEVIENFLYKVTAKRITQSTGIDESKLGSNPSEEACEDKAEDGTITGVDVVIGNRLVETFFSTKKQFQEWLRVYMKSIVELLPEDKQPSFKSCAQASVKTLLKGFDDYQFYMGEAMNGDGCIGCMWYADDGNPYLYFIKEGLDEEKV